MFSEHADDVEHDQCQQRHNQHQDGREGEQDDVNFIWFKCHSVAIKPRDAVRRICLALPRVAIGGSG
jgi:hypothetical protein